jgi:hypothetical protein
MAGCAQLRALAYDRCPLIAQERFLEVQVIRALLIFAAAMRVLKKPETIDNSSFQFSIKQ